MDTVYLSQKEFDSLLNYSCSLPTGTTVGKRWKCNRNAYREPPSKREPDWWMGEYYMDETIPEGQIGIRWSKIVVGVLPKKNEQLPVHLL